MTTFHLICIILFAIAAIALIVMIVVLRPERTGNPRKKVRSTSATATASTP